MHFSTLWSLPPGPGLEVTSRSLEQGEREREELELGLTVVRNPHQMRELEQEGCQGSYGQKISGAWSPWS